ncbi:ARM repeat-containing protein [Rhizopus microsporus var. microsporus]|uniref:ARM repeat-containing protein n=1 Tax=Rhizopus microsporus var. microsporus TaxID=86635 RepID=A0A1X0RCF5_RHIZD|nr:ARM repeat-containing protein [Rhizopus microsporus var. microsporus]
MNAPFDVTELDRTVKAFYEGNDTRRQAAQAVITDFQKDPNSWQIVDQILEQSSYLQTKFIALNILEDFIRVRWNTLPVDQRLVLRNYIVKMIVDISSNQSSFQSQKLLLNKLNVVLVQIVKKEWPKHWPTFMQEIVESSFAGITLCENNIKIIRLLSEEVFDYSTSFLTQVKMKRLKEQMKLDFSLIIDLCNKVLMSANQRSLIMETMSTVQNLTTWMPVEYAYEDNFIQLIQTKLYESPYQLLALQCFNGILNLENTMQPKKVYDIVFPYINSMKETIINSNYEQNYTLIKEVAIFVITMLTKYKNCVSDINQILMYLLSISRISDIDICKICTGYWETFVEQDNYRQIQRELAVVITETMVMPNDILRVQDEDGEIIQEYVKQSDTAALYDSMQHILQAITKREPEFIQSVLHDRLLKIQMASDITTHYDMLFKISWAVGALSDTLTVETEKIFLKTIVHDYVQLSEKTKSQDWAIVSCTLYISGQYPRFLSFHHDFMNFILQKIFALLYELNSDVKDMVCNTLLKVSQGFHKQSLQNEVLSETLLKQFELLSTHLDQHQASMLYESAAYIILTMPSLDLQLSYLNSIMARQNTVFIHAVGSSSLDSLKAIIQYLKINIVICKVLGSLYGHHLKQIIPSLIECYKIANDDEHSLLHKHIRKAIIQLLECFILSINSQVDISEIQGLLQVIAAGYVQSNDQREPLVLSLLTDIFEKIDNPVATVWPAILNQTIDIVFSHTLSMLTQNFSDFPDIRTQFYRLLEVIVKRYLQDIFRTPELLDSVINCIIWGTKHTQTEISHTALKTCLFVLDNALQEDDDVASQFFETYYVRILTDTLEILLDPDCRNGFEYQTQIISKMLRMIQEGEIYTRVFNPEQVSNPLMSNMEFLQNYILDLLTNTYPLLQKSQLEVLVMGMFDYSDDLQRFQNDIQDFLIDIREVDEESVGYERAQEETEAELELLRNI